jgi:hypothetical protein
MKLKLVSAHSGYLLVSTFGTEHLACAQLVIHVPCIHQLVSVTILILQRFTTKAQLVILVRHQSTDYQALPDQRSVIEA